MVTPLTEMAFTSQSATRAEIYTDNGKQSVISTAESIAEAISRQSKAVQQETDSAQRPMDTVEISNEARELLQKSVSGGTNLSHQQDADTKDGKTANEQGVSPLGDAGEGTPADEMKQRIRELQERLKEAQKELQQAQQELSAAQSKLGKANDVQAQLSAEAEVQAAQQRMSSAQQQVQIIMNELLEAQKGAA